MVLEVLMDYKFIVRYFDLFVLHWKLNITWISVYFWAICLEGIDKLEDVFRNQDDKWGLKSYDRRNSQRSWMFVT